jgi:hypothetical protein
MNVAARANGTVDLVVAASGTPQVVLCSQAAQFKVPVTVLKVRSNSLWAMR